MSRPAGAPRPPGPFPLVAAVPLALLAASLSARAWWLDPWTAGPREAALGMALAVAGQASLAALALLGPAFLRATPARARRGLAGLSVAALSLVALAAMASASVRLLGAWREYRLAGSDVVLFRPHVGPSEDGTAISVRGEIVPGAASRLAALADARPDLRTVRLLSTGGVLDEGIALARAISARGLSTEVVALCASACAVAFLGGRRRVVREGDMVVFHGTYVEVLGIAVDKAAPDKRALFAAAGVAPWFVAMAVREGHDNEWAPSAGEMRDSGYATEVAPPWPGGAPVR